MAKKMAIAIKKGGVGKTTTTTNLGASMALQGNRVLLIDLDQQANATKGLGFDPDSTPGSVNDLFADPSRHPSTAIIETGIENFHLMPGHPDLAKTETGMAFQRMDPAAPDPIGALRAILEPLEDLYDVILFDTPPSINFMTINALAAADELLIPAAASAYTEDGVIKTLEEYERAKGSYNQRLQLRGILITRMKRTNASAAVADELREAYKDATLFKAIVESTSVDEAAQVKKPVVVYDPDSHAARGYMEIAANLMEEGSRG
ncbi:ParA family protein [Streptomyces sp. NPDC090075]|uniref:ParA family protein n=1 Tax=Streptomyces sp. NPDC090075 TaxID=3365937 RepID=UPI0038288398